MTNYVFSLGLIPVQEWIAQARRSRDLRAGSVFLWHVMARLLAMLERELAEVEVWTPRAPEGGFARLAGLSFEAALGEVSYGIPNRASGCLEAEDDKELTRIFQGLEREVVVAWERLRHLASRDLQEKSPLWPAFKPHWSAYEKATPQGEDCPLTLIWVAEPARHSREDRKESLREIDLRFSDLKRSRPLRAWELGAPVGKCSQCGRREAMGPQESFEKWQDWHGRRSEEPWIQHGYRLDAGERLCYVCLVRRMAGYATTDRKDFPSTGEVAAQSWLARLESFSPLHEIVKQLERTALGQLDFGRALYGSVEALPDPVKDEVRKLREEIREEISRQNRQPASPEWPSPLALDPPSHLALLTFDGDDMGRRVQADPDRASDALARFAEAAAGLLEKHQGTSFYLAGDEGLAMAPAETALDLAFALRKAFADAWDDHETKPTLSLGIAFFEQGRPMRGAILAARGALESAKSCKGKNALGVAVETASGSRWGFTARWGEGWERIRKASALLREGRLSAGWAYDAERFLETFSEEDWGSDVAGAARAELRRLFLRRVHGEGKTAEERRADRRRLWEELPGDSWWKLDETGRVPPPDPQQLHLIGFLARQGTTRPAEGAEE